MSAEKECLLCSQKDCNLCRYTSYGRHYTQDSHLRTLSSGLLDYIQSGDNIVDFSSGGNDWVPMLKTMCLEQEKVSILFQCRISACKP